MSAAVTECLAEIERLRAEVEDLRAENERLEKTLNWVIDKKEALEELLATMRGSLAPHPADDEPGNYTHNIPPNAPT
jgi:chromosome segregation ATPase